MEWRPIPAFRLYEASEDGRIRNALTLRELRQRPHPMGYRMVDLHAGVKAGFGAEVRQVAKLVHRLVCETFHGPGEPGQQAAHNDGDRTNSRADNLRWASVAENHADKKLHGTNNHGEANGRRKLTEQQALEILTAARSGEKHGPIAQRYGISAGQVGKIARGEKWAHLPRA